MSLQGAPSCGIAEGIVSVPAFTSLRPGRPHQRGVDFRIARLADGHPHVPTHRPLFRSLDQRLLEKSGGIDLSSASVSPFSLSSGAKRHFTRVVLLSFKIED